MDLYTVIVLACAAGFFISAVDYFLDIGIFRALIGLIAGLIGGYLLGLTWSEDIVAGCAAGFIGLGLLQIIERINYRGRVR